MPERLVDVLKNGQSLLHTFPVQVSETGDAEPVALSKGGDAAAYAGLVPGTERDDLSTRLHVDRGGAIEPPGDRLPVSAETKPHLEQCVREHAYRLWEQDGRPDGDPDVHWHRAYAQHIRERAYRLWQFEGCPEGRADEYWHRTLAFERD